MKNVITLLILIGFLLGLETASFSEEPETSGFDREQILKKLSSSERNVRKKAVEKIEKAGVKGYQFLKSISSPSKTSLSLTVTVKDEVVKPGAAVTLSMTLRNTGPSGTWIPYNQQSGFVPLKISGPEEKTVIHDRFSVSIKFPVYPSHQCPKRGGSIISGWASDHLKRMVGHRLWHDLKKVLYLQPGDEIRWQPKRKMSKRNKPFTVYKFQGSYPGYKKKNKLQTKIKLPRAWKQLNQNKNTNMKPFYLQHCSQQAEDQALVYTQPAEKHYLNQNIQLLFSQDVTADNRSVLRGRLRFTNKSRDKSYGVLNFNDRHQSPFSYLVMDRRMTRVIDSGSLNRSKKKHIQKTLTIDSWMQTEILKDSSFRENFSHLPSSGMIKRSLSIPWNLEPGMYKLILMYGDVDYSLKDRNNRGLYRSEIENKIKPLSFLGHNVFSRPIPVLVLPADKNGSQEKSKLSKQSREEAWNQLKNDDEKAIRQATMDLVQQGESIIPFLRKKMEPSFESSKPLTPEVKRYIALLGHTKYRKRESAMKELSKMLNKHGPAVAKWLYRTLQKTNDPEVQRRIKRLLQYDYPSLTYTPGSPNLGRLRAIDVLALINNSSSKQLLKEVHAMFKGTKIGRKSGYTLIERPNQ